MDKQVIYCITDPNGKKYIGQTSYYEKNSKGNLKPIGLARRWSGHKSHAKKGLKTLLCEAIRIFGYEKFTVEELEICDLDKSDEREKYYIQTMNTLHPNGYNKQVGGGVSSNHSLNKTPQSLSDKRCVPDPQLSAAEVDRNSLPLGINFMYCKRGYHSYIVRDVQSRFPTKTFRSGKKTLDKCLEDAKEYLKQYIPENKWITENKMAVNKIKHRSKEEIERRANEIDKSKLPVYIYFGNSAKGDHYISVKDSSKDKKFSEKTFRSSDNKSLSDCLKHAEEYLETHIPRNEWKQKTKNIKIGK